MTALQMLAAISLSLLAMGHIIPHLSGAQILSSDTDFTIARETAYYFLSEHTYAFYFPTRLKNHRLTQVCILVHHTRSELRCTFDSPRVQFEIDGEYQRKISVTWQMKYSGNISDSFFKDVFSESVDYNIIGLETRPETNLRVEIVSPKYAAIVASNPYISYELDIKYLPDSTTLLSSSIVNFQVQGILKGYEAPLNAKYLEGQSNTDPGSWFYLLKPVVDILALTGIRRYHGYPNPGYMEFVLTADDIHRNRMYSSVWREDQFETHSILDNCSKEQAHTYDSIEQFNQSVIPISICIWGNFKMDGQKKIFLKQIQYLSKDDFKFVWVAADAIDGGNEVLFEVEQHSEFHNQLKLMSNVKIVYSPYASVALNMTEIDAQSPSQSAQWMKNQSMMYDFIAMRFKHAGGDIDIITPLWVKRLYALMRTHMMNEECSIIVYGNGRGPSSNLLITDTARTLGIPTVTELVNLFISPDAVPSAVVGPSLYSIEHERKILKQNCPSDISGDIISDDKGVKFKIIPPSVDIDRFNSDRIEEMDVIYHPHCQNIRKYNILSECYTVGFIGRLSAEKNPGLFLLTAAKILSINPFIRFTIVGDGDLRPHLEDLSHRLGITWAIHFAGWIREELLPNILKGFDIVINTSLKETFCIANIEVMSMGIPLITFAVGGESENFLLSVPAILRMTNIMNYFDYMWWP